MVSNDKGIFCELDVKAHAQGHEYQMIVLVVVEDRVQLFDSNSTLLIQHEFHSALNNTK
jgi:hypothetical protein